MDNIHVTNVDHILYCYLRRQDSMHGTWSQPETMLTTKMILNMEQDILRPVQCYHLNMSFSKKMYLYLRDCASRDHEHLQYVWTLFWKVLAMYENTKLINKGLLYFLCVKCFQKVLIPRKIYKQICLYFYLLQNISISYITNSALHACRIF